MALTFKVDEELLEVARAACKEHVEALLSGEAQVIVRRDEKGRLRSTETTKNAASRVRAIQLAHAMFGSEEMPRVLPDETVRVLADDTGSQKALERLKSGEKIR
jgi:hypothetical protein